jgi:hypothetical protein
VFGVSENLKLLYCIAFGYRNKVASVNRVRMGARRAGTKRHVLEMKQHSEPGLSRIITYGRMAAIRIQLGGHERQELGALLPDRSMALKWRVPAGAAIPTGAGERLGLVGNCHRRPHNASCPLTPTLLPLKRVLMPAGCRR